MLLLLFIFFIEFISAEPSLSKLNEKFHEIYQYNQRKALAKTDPIILVGNGKITLLFGEERKEADYIPPLYHKLKEVDHIPLMLHLLLKTFSEECTPKQLEELRSFKEAIDSHILGQEFPPQLLQRQKQILRKTTDFIDEVLREQKCLSSSRSSFFSSLGPMLLDNASEAVRLQLEALHKQVSFWKALFTGEQWDRLAVIVMGPQLPRIGEVTMQYFSRLTGKPPEGYRGNFNWVQCSKEEWEKKKNRRLIYAENISNEESALQLLGTHIVDEEIGWVFFHDKMRMKADLLAEAASRYLELMCDKEKPN